MFNEERRVLFVKLGIALVVFIVALFLVFIINRSFNSKAKASGKYLILGNYLIMQKKINGFVQMESLDDSILDFSYDISDGNNTVKNVTMQFLNNGWYFFDKDYNEIEMSKFRVATHNLSVSLGNYNIISVQSPLEDEFIKDFLDNNDIERPETYNVVYKIVFDFDNDGNDEYIYTLSNYSLSATAYDQNGYLFIVQNGSIVYHSSLKETSPYTVMEILDLDNDESYEMVVNKGNKDLKTFDSCYQIYKLKNNNWKIIKDCE